MNTLDKAKDTISKLSIKTESLSKKLKASTKNKAVWWEVFAYVIRTLSVAAPVVVLNTINQTWTKTSFGLTTTLMIVVLLIIYKPQIKKLSSYAPGSVTFAIFLVISYFLYSTAETFMIIGACGLGGSVAASPLHIKYLNSLKKVEDIPSDEVLALREISEKLNKE